VSQDRQALIAELMGRPGSGAADVVGDFARALGLPTRLSEVGISPSDFTAIAEHTMTDAGVRSNPRPIAGPADIVEILELAK
jgi:alcohol dehydrogenase class IV